MNFIDEYVYQWSLVTHPEGDQVGEMVGINTNELKLSGVSNTCTNIKLLPVHIDNPKTQRVTYSEIIQSVLLNVVYFNIPN